MYVCVVVVGVVRVGCQGLVCVCVHEGGSMCA